MTYAGHKGKSEVCLEVHVQDRNDRRGRAGGSEPFGEGPVLGQEPCEHRPQKGHTEPQGRLLEKLRGDRQAPAIKFRSDL